MASEVKGVWFVTARRYLMESGQEDVIARMVARLDEPHRTTFATPSASEWYPEASLAATLQLLREECGSQREERYVALMEAITLVGINRFFRLVLAVSSADFVLRKIPTMWAHIRRGAGKVTVETDERGATIRYSEFPWFDEPTYRLMTEGSIRALLGAVNVAGDVRLGAFTRSTLVVNVTYRNRRSD